VAVTRSNESGKLQPLVGECGKGKYSYHWCEKLPPLAGDRCICDSAPQGVCQELAPLVQQFGWSHNIVTLEPVAIRGFGKSNHRLHFSDDDREGGGVRDFAPKGQPQISPGQSGAAIAAQRRPGVGKHHEPKP
jgi:hypothetical protein